MILRLAAMWAILCFINCAGQSHETVSLYLHFWRERWAEEGSRTCILPLTSRAPYPPGQDGSTDVRVFVLPSYAICWTSFTSTVWLVKVVIRGCVSWMSIKVKLCCVVCQCAGWIGKGGQDEWCEVSVSNECECRLLRNESPSRSWTVSGALLIDLLKAYSPAKRTGSPKGFSQVQISQVEYNTMYLLKDYSPVNRTGSHEDFSQVQMSQVEYNTKHAHYNYKNVKHINIIRTLVLSVLLS